MLPAAAAPVERALDVAKAEKKEVAHSMIGIRNTLLFYIWKDQQTALRLSINNDSTKFPVQATVYLFDPDTTGETIDRWLNNQHSDGLFMDAAKPEKTVELPASSAKVTVHKLLDPNKKERNGVFSAYEVTVEVTDPAADDGFLLKDFKDTAKVFVKQVDG